MPKIDVTQVPVDLSEVLVVNPAKYERDDEAELQLLAKEAISENQRSIEAGYYSIKNKIIHLKHEIEILNPLEDTSENKKLLRLFLEQQLIKRNVTRLGNVIFESKPVEISELEPAENQEQAILKPKKSKLSIEEKYALKRKNAVHHRYIGETCYPVIIPAKCEDPSSTVTTKYVYLSRPIGIIDRIGKNPAKTGVVAEVIGDVIEGDESRSLCKRIRIKFISDGTGNTTQLVEQPHRGFLIGDNTSWHLNELKLLRSRYDTYKLKNPIYNHDLYLNKPEQAILPIRIIEGVKLSKYLEQHRHELSALDLIDLTLALLAELDYFAHHEIVRLNIQPDKILISRDARGVFKATFIGIRIAKHVKDTDAALDFRFPSHNLFSAYEILTRGEYGFETDVCSLMYCIGAVFGATIGDISQESISGDLTFATKFSESKFVNLFSGIHDLREEDKKTIAEVFRSATMIKVGGERFLRSATAYDQGKAASNQTRISRTAIIAIFEFLHRKYASGYAQYLKNMDQLSKPRELTCPENSYRELVKEYKKIGAVLCDVFTENNITFLKFKDNLLKLNNTGNNALFHSNLITRFTALTNLVRVITRPFDSDKIATIIQNMKDRIAIAVSVKKFLDDIYLLKFSVVLATYVAEGKAHLSFMQSLWNSDAGQTRAQNAIDMLNEDDDQESKLITCFAMLSDGKNGKHFKKILDEITGLTTEQMRDILLDSIMKNKTPEEKAIIKASIRAKIEFFETGKKYESKGYYLQ